MITPSQVNFLNFSRWFSAWVVCAEHLRNLLFVDYGSLADPSLFWKLFYFATGFGHEAVVIFFVISGYLVGGKVWERMESGTFRPASYCIDRFTRLYIVLVPALLLCWVLDTVGRLHFNTFGLYTLGFDDSIATVTQSLAAQSQWPIFLGNLAMLQTIVTPVFGSNGPLWSLAYEFWYYLLFPLILALVYGKWPIRGLSLLLLIFLGWFLHANLLLLGICWLFGVGVYRLQGTLRVPLVMSLALFALGLGVMRLEWLDGYWPSYLVGLGFSGLLLSLRTLPFPHFPRLNQHLADFSYSLYLVHFPMLAFVLSALHTLTGTGLRMDNSPLTLLLFGAVAVAVLLAAYVFSLFSEARTGSVRSLIKKHWLH